MTKTTFLYILKLTVPVFFGYIAIGIPFGLMVINAGYPFWLAPLMSVVMFAGAGQYMAIALFAAGAGLPAIALAMLLLNVRHIVYGLSLIEPFKRAGKWRLYLIFALTDETYALMTSYPAPDGIPSGPFYGTIALLDHLYWISGTVIGALAGSLLSFSFAGVDFALTALFAVLLIEQLKKTRRGLPVIIGLGVTVLSILVVPSQHVLIVSLALGIAALGILRGKGEINGSR
jgi:4-azaleucine resistance transporter AzlC